MASHRCDAGSLFLMLLRQICSCGGRSIGSHYLQQLVLLVDPLLESSFDLCWPSRLRPESCSLQFGGCSKDIQIPHKVVLEMLLANLGLEPAQYECIINDDHKIHVTVIFNTAALDLGGTIIDVIVPGDYCTDDEPAEDTAAIRVVRYMETMTNTITRDLNHTKTKRQESCINSQKKQLKMSNVKGKKHARDDDMEIVEVSGPFLGMLDKLDLSLPRYHSRAHKKGQFITEVVFYPSMEHQRAATPTYTGETVKISPTLPAKDNRSCFYKGNSIYGRSAENGLQDYGYSELKRSEATNSDLIDLLAEKDRKRTAMSFGGYIDTVFLTCDQICQLVLHQTVWSTRISQKLKLLLS